MIALDVNGTADAFVLESALTDGRTPMVKQRPASSRLTVKETDGSMGNFLGTTETVDAATITFNADWTTAGRAK